MPSSSGDSNNLPAWYSRRLVAPFDNLSQDSLQSFLPFDSCSRLHQEDTSRAAAPSHAATAEAE